MNNPPRRRRELFSEIILFGISGVAWAALGFTVLNHHVYPGGLNALIVYYALPLVCAISFIVLAKRLKPSAKSNLVLFIVATGIALYIVELVLIEISTSKNLIAARTSQQPFDARSKYEVIQQLRSDGIQAYTTTYPGLFLNNGLDAANENEVLLPLGGIANRTLVFCNESGTYTIYKSDEYGFRNPPGLYQADQIDIVLLGDSFTHGACVGEGEDIGAWIREIYPHTINLGSSGNGPLLMLATLKEYIVPLRPKNIFWIYYENDLIDLKTEMSSWITRYLEDDTSQNLINRQSEIDQALIRYTEGRELYNKMQHPVLKFLRLKTLRAKLKHLSKMPGDSSNEDPETPETIELFKNILIETKETAGEWGGTLYFVYLAGYETLSHPAGQGRQRKLVLAIVDELEIPLIDTQQSFLKKENPVSYFPFKRSNHYNAMGYKLVADAILLNLTEIH